MLDRLCLLNLNLDTQEDSKPKSLKGKSLLKKKNDFEKSGFGQKYRKIPKRTNFQKANGTNEQIEVHRHILPLDCRYAKTDRNVSADTNVNADRMLNAADITRFKCSKPDARCQMPDA